MHAVVFASDDYKKYIDGIRIDTLPDVSMSCIARGVISGAGSLRRRGVFDSDGKLVAPADMRRSRHVDHIRVPGKCEYIDADAVFMGQVHWHFGHFLTECTGRMWAAIDTVPNRKYVFIGNPLADPAPEYVFEFMEQMGVSRDDVIILRHTARFRRVFVPDMSVVRDASSGAWASTFGAMAKNAVGGGRVAKIYVSRTAMTDGRKTFGEERIQEIFARNGFQIIHPEQMSLAQQVAVIKNCKVLAGCAGTALHLALFMKPGGTVIQLKRNSKISDNAPMQILINKTCGLKSVFVDAAVEKIPSDHYTVVPQIIGVTPYLMSMFRDMKFDVTDEDMVPDADAFAEYTAAYDEYVRRTGGLQASRRRRRIARIISGFIFIPTLRHRFYEWLKRVMHVE